MRNVRVLAIILAVTVAVFSAFPSSAGPAEDLAAAYARGDYRVALAIVEPRAKSGDADASCYLGVHYNHGLGVAANPETAAFWFKAAADKGHAMAMIYLGVLYLDGRGVKGDAAEAVRLFRAAADQGNDFGQYWIGRVHAEGVGVAKDASEAARWYRLSADRGNSRAQNNLAALYLRGEGVAKDPAEAIRWYRLAAAQASALDSLEAGIAAYQRGEFDEAIRLLGDAISDGGLALHRNWGRPMGNGETPIMTEACIGSQGIMPIC